MKIQIETGYARQGFAYRIAYHGGDECAVLSKFCWSSAYIG